MLPEHIKSIRALLEHFPTEKSCLEYFEFARWDGKPVSPFDPKSKVYRCKNGKYFCKNTRKYFTGRNDSIFEKTKIPLRDWFLAIWLMNSCKKGVSSLLLVEHIGVSKQTAWNMGMKIRQFYGMEAEECESGVFILDEAVFGGLNGNRRKDKKIPNSQGGHTHDKTWVFGIIQRNGKLRAYVIPSRSPEYVHPIIRRLAKPGSIMINDSWTGYNGLDEYRQYVVKDGKQSFTYNPEVHTNDIEGAWGIMKRGYNGIYNWWSKKYLQYYINEFVFRYNTRKMTTRERFSLFLSKVYRRLTYADVKAAVAWTE